MFIILFISFVDCFFFSFPTDVRRARREGGGDADAGDDARVAGAASGHCQAARPQEDKAEAGGVYIPSATYPPSTKCRPRRSTTARMKRTV
eukprot:1176076-Prorocentrum_minimum.AAC.7